jgi:hypothetical protein
VITNPKVPEDTKAAFESMVNPLFWQFASLRLTRGQRTRVDISSSAYRKGIPPAWRGSLRDPVVVGIEYIGLVEFQGIRAAALRLEFNDMLQSPVYKGRMRIDNLDIETICFIDLTTGLTLTEYQKSVSSGQLDGKPATMHIVQSNALDRESTGGF